MAKNLVIVESPAKAKTIEGYLGKDYKVASSMGHIRDLRKGNGAIDIENNFEPTYEVSEENRYIDDFPYCRVSFKLGEHHWLTFNPRDGWNYRITISYTKPLKNHETAYYEKKINRELYGSVETIFEFTESDRINSS